MGHLTLSVVRRRCRATPALVGMQPTHYVTPSALRRICCVTAFRV